MNPQNLPARMLGAARMGLCSLALAQLSFGAALARRPCRSSSEYADHVSILKFIERNWSLGTISQRSRDNFPTVWWQRPAAR
jgi:hypothetical protein